MNIPTVSAPRAGGLELDRLGDHAEHVEVVLFGALEVDGDGDAPRRQHRHERLWARTGGGAR